MLWPEQVEIFPDVVYGAHDEREFLTLCQHALEEAPGFVSQRRQSYGAAAGLVPPSRCGIPYFGHCRGCCEQRMPTFLSRISQFLVQAYEIHSLSCKARVFSIKWNPNGWKGA